MLCLPPKFFSVDYINSCPFITGGCTECPQILSKPTVGMPVRTTGLPPWQKPLQTVKLHQCMVLPAPHLDMGHCTVCRNTFMLWSFNILGGFEGFSNYQVSCHDKHNLQRAACVTPHFSLRCGNTPLYPSIGSGHGLAGSGTNLWKLGLPVNGTIVLPVSLLPDSFLKADIYFPTSWAVSEVNRDELKDLMLAAWKANNSVPGTVTRQLVNINFSKSVTLTALSKNDFFRPKEHILGNLHSKTHLGTFQTINLHLSGF